MPAPPSGLDPDARLRAELAALLRGGQAHVAAAAALDGIPPERVNERPHGLPYSLWALVWHLHFTQADILEFVRGPYEKKVWPADYWPAHDATPHEWEKTRAAFLADLDAAVALAAEADLTAELPHAPGYTVLRELLLIADHNAHHLGEVIVLRRLLGLWG
jgi:uncharacterized damage-inducible protein DinB